MSCLILHVDQMGVPASARIRAALLDLSDVKLSSDTEH